MLREAILKRMEELDMSTNHLARLLEGRIPRRTVYDYLTGTSDSRSSVVSALLEVLDLTVIVKPKRSRARGPGKEKPT